MGSTSQLRNDSDRGAWLALLLAAIAVVTGQVYLHNQSMLVLATPVAVVIGIGLALLAIKRFEWFVLLLLVIRPSLDAVKLGPGRSLFDPSVVVTVLFLITGLLWIAIRRFSGDRPPLLGITLPIIAMLIAGLLSLPSSADLWASLVEVMRIGAFGVIIAVLYRLLMHEETTRPWTAAMFLSMVVPVGVGLFQVFTRGGSVTDGDFARVSGTFVHPNPFALYLVILILFGVALFPHVRWMPRLGIVVLLAGGAVALTWTFTRTAWVSLLAALFVMAWLGNRKLILLLLAAVFVAAILVPAIPARFADLGTTVQATGATGNSLVWRFQYWQESLSLVKNPLTGIGLGMVQESTAAAKLPHNDFIRMYVEMGVVGLSAYLWFVAAVIRLAWRLVQSPLQGLARGVALAFAGATVAFILASLVSNLISQLVVLWYFGAIGAGAGALQARKPSAYPQDQPT